MRYFRRIMTRLSEKEKIKILTHLKPVSKTAFADDMTEDTLASVRAVKTIQEKNGEAGCNRYIISQCNSATECNGSICLVPAGRMEKRSYQPGHRSIV